MVLVKIINGMVEVEAIDVSYDTHSVLLATEQKKAHGPWPTGTTRSYLAG
jgi:hypothetical protein